MSIKDKSKAAVRKTLETIDKGLKWAQDNPVVVERTVLVVVTVVLTRSAYKRFNPQNVVKLAAPQLKPTVNHLVDNIPVHVDIEMIRPISPVSYDIVDSVKNLEVSDVDIRDMETGDLLGLVFNVQDFDGVKNTPLAVMPYSKLMHYVHPTFPIHQSAEALLDQN